MPINTVQRLVHLRTQKNQQILQSVARLWELGRHAKTEQDILDGLHPWGKHNELKFYNTLPKILVMIGVTCFILGWFLHPYLPYVLSVLFASGCCFLAFLVYESYDPIEEVIDYLEQRMMLLKFDLHFQSMPSIFTQTSSSTLMLSQLKQLFPLFSQGSVSNEIGLYASTTWIDDTGVSHPVMLFQYHFVSDFKISNAEGKRQKVKEIHKDLWGAFIFQTPARAFAASDKRKSFFYPYHFKWQSSDILLNQKIHLFGDSQQHLARNISPSMTLKLANFFEENSGDLISHFQESIIFFMGENNLLRRSNKKQADDIRNISELRGYLRTLNMPAYQQFQQSMLKFLS